MHEIEDSFKKKIKDQFEPVFEKKYRIQKDKPDVKEKDKHLPGVEKEKGTHSHNDREKHLAALTKKKLTYQRKEHGLTIIEK